MEEDEGSLNLKENLGAIHALSQEAINRMSVYSSNDIPNSDVWEVMKSIRKIRSVCGKLLTTLFSLLLFFAPLEAFAKDDISIYVGLLKERMECEVKLSTIEAKSSMQFSSEVNSYKARIESLEGEVDHLKSLLVYRTLTPEAERVSRVWSKAIRDSLGFIPDQHNVISDIRLKWEEWSNMKVGEGLQKTPFYIYFLDRRFETIAKVGSGKQLYENYLSYYENPNVLESDLELSGSEEITRYKNQEPPLPLSPQSNP